MGSNHFLPLILLVAIVYLSSTTWIPAEGSQGSDLLDQKESEVTSLKIKVEENYRGRCESLRTCGAPMNCSRNSCWPLDLGDIKNYLTCKTVVSNTYCPYCQSKYFDFTRSYIRLASTTDITSIDTTAIICSLRGLDTVFKSVCNESSHSRAFLGTVDGTYIHFPGSDRSEEDCLKYDPRFRPWYRASTSVKKAVMVLVDGGALISPLSTPLTGTFLGLTHDIVTDLLNTLSEQDVVNIITYDNSKATPLAPSPLQFVYNVSAYSTYHPEFAGLLGNLSSAVSSGGSSNIAFGIREALNNYASHSEHMKIIIVFTNASSVNFLKNGSLAALGGQNVKVFVFTLPDQADTVTPTDSPFLTQLQSLGGSYNVLTTSEIENRLLSILPYFSFLAKFRASLNDSADYSLIYQDFEHVVNNTFSITKPAFADDGRLIGIVGLNIFVDELPVDIVQSVNDSLSGRTGGKTFDQKEFVLTAANASIQNGPSISTVGQCNGPSIQLPSNAGLCARNDTSSIQHLACCGACNIRSNSKVKYIIGIVVGAAVIIAVVLLIACLVRRWQADERELKHLNSPPPPPLDQQVYHLAQGTSEKD